MQQMINKIPPKSVHFDNTVHARFRVNTAVTLVYAIWGFPLHSNSY